MTPDDARHAKPGPCCEIRRKRFGVPTFGEIVQLLVQHARELGQKGWNVRAPPDGRPSVQPRANGTDRGEVDGDQGLDVRPLDFNHDVHEVVGRGRRSRLNRRDQRRSMDLSERCRRQRHLVNRGELLSQRTAELAFDDGAHRGERLGRNFVLQAGQFLM